MINVKILQMDRSHTDDPLLVSIVNAGASFYSQKHIPRSRNRGWTAALGEWSLLREQGRWKSSQFEWRKPWRARTKQTSPPNIASRILQIQRRTLDWRVFGMPGSTAQRSTDTWSSMMLKYHMYENEQLTETKKYIAKAETIRTCIRDPRVKWRANPVSIRAMKLRFWDVGKSHNKW